MNARIEKKLSKRIIAIVPSLFNDVWIDKEVSEVAENQGVRVSHIPCVGGGVDYWGEGQDSYTAWAWFEMNWYWLGNFPRYPEGHKFEFMPNTEGFKPTTVNLLRLARNAAA